MDFDLNSSSLTFKAGEITKLLTIEISDDEIFEQKELLRLEILVPEEFRDKYIMEGDPNVTTVVIKDNEG